MTTKNNLELGRQYVRRDGEVTGPLVSNEWTDRDRYPFHDPEHEEIYALDGTWNVYKDFPDHGDLVSVVQNDVERIAIALNRVVELQEENSGLYAEREQMQSEIQRLKTQLNEIYGKEGTPAPDLYRQAVTAEQIEDNLTKKPKTYAEGLDAGIEVLQSLAEQMLVEALELNRTTDLSKRAQAIEIARGYLADVEFLVELKAKEHTL